jgi:hypothetical protein
MVQEGPGAYDAAPGGQATGFAPPGWAFNIPADLSADEELELQSFLDYLRYRREQRGRQ